MVPEFRVVIAKQENVQRFDKVFVANAGFTRLGVDVPAGKSEADSVFT